MQQGDNLGPLLFALALQPILEQLAGLRGQGLDIVAAYLDDVVVAGDDAAVLEAFRLLCSAAPGIGLQLRFDKCELIPTDGRVSSPSLAVFPGAVQRKSQANFDLLGAPIGDREFCEGYTRRKRVDKASTRLTSLGDLCESHAEYKILSSCLGSCKVMHAMRTTRPDCISDSLGSFDAAVINAMGATLGEALPEVARAQAQLSSSAGGLGLRSAREHAECAFLASLVGTFTLCQELDSSFVWGGAGLAEAARAFNAKVAPQDQLDFTLSLIHI